MAAWRKCIHINDRGVFISDLNKQIIKGPGRKTTGPFCFGVDRNDYDRLDDCCCYHANHKGRF